MTDLVVELGDVSSGTLRDALARALGDPTLRVGYWLAETGAYVDGAGERVELPEPGSPRAVTSIERDGRPLAVLIHDQAVLDDPGLVEGVAAAARLAAANARLQAEVRVQVADLAASRRRLLEAGDEERRRLELRLREGAARRLEALGELLATARSAPGSASGDHFGQAERQLERALDDLHELALGLHPRELVEEGLEGAVRGLADRSPVPVELEHLAGTGRVGGGGRRLLPVLGGAREHREARVRLAGRDSDHPDREPTRDRGGRRRCRRRRPCPRLRPAAGS